MGAGCRRGGENQGFVPNSEPKAESGRAKPLRFSTFLRNLR
nr:MAG TPA: hypothetical protein [Caudoviricetes sp.]